MPLSEVGAINFLQPSSLEIPPRKHLSAVRPDEDGEQAPSPREKNFPSPVQDQVNVSKEAQALAASTTRGLDTHPFQQSPSPFDH